MAKLGLSWVDEEITGPFIEAINLNKLTGAVEDANTFYPVGGTANALLITTPNGNYSYNANTMLNMTIDSDNTGAMTANVDSAGTTSLLDEDGTAFTGGEFEAGQRVTFVRNSANTNFTYAPKGGGNIKSVQRGSFILQNDLTSDTFNISEVDLTKSVILVSIRAGIIGQYPNEAVASVSFQDSTTVLVEKNATTTDVAKDAYVDWQVIEYKNVKSLQSGSTIIAQDADSNESISSVDLSKSILFFSHRPDTTYNSCSGAIMIGQLTSSTNIRFRNGNSQTDSVAEWFVVEFR